MNLYIVYEKTGSYCSDYGTYVFAETANRAKSMMVCHYSDEQYVDLRVNLLKKDVGGKEEIIDTEEGCDRLSDLDFRYMTESEQAAYEG